MLAINSPKRYASQVPPLLSEQRKKGLIPCHTMTLRKHNRLPDLGASLCRLESRIFAIRECSLAAQQGAAPYPLCKLVAALAVRARGVADDPVPDYVGSGQVMPGQVSSGPATRGRLLSANRSKVTKPRLRLGWSWYLIREGG